MNSEWETDRLVISHLNTPHTLSSSGLSFYGLALRIPLVEQWAGGVSFSQLVMDHNLAEGAIIRIFRQAIDVMEQVRRATDSESLKEKLTGSISLLDREVVSVSFE